MLRLKVSALVGLGSLLAMAMATDVMAGGVTCKEPEPGKTSGGTNKTGTDGSFCSANSDGGPTLASASGSGSVATASADVQGKGTSHAKTGGLAESDGEDGGTASATASSSGSAMATASGDHPGNNPGVDHTKATAKASNLGTAVATSVLQGTAFAGANSGTATAHTNEGGGTAKATSFKNGTAFADSLAFCFATAGASDPGSDASASCLTDLGSAKAFAQRGSAAEAKSDDACTTSAIASSKSTAKAHCTKPDSIIKATATGGATAIGDDQGPGLCDTSAGGTAKVRSNIPGGDCG